jgi:Ca2+-binding EF-hand superfamily protein
MNTKVFLTLMAGVVMAASFAAVAGPGWNRGGCQQQPTAFEKFDLNSDGLITAQEHAAVRAAKREAKARLGYPMRNAAYAPAFESIDADHSGAIDRAELAQFQANRMQARAMRQSRWNR